MSVADKLIERYPGVPGCRLDDGGRNNEGPALDLASLGSDFAYRLWVRDHDGQAELIMDVTALLALWDGIGRQLVEAGALRESRALVRQYERGGRQ